MRKLTTVIVIMSQYPLTLHYHRSCLSKEKHRRHSCSSENAAHLKNQSSSTRTNPFAFVRLPFRSVSLASTNPWIFRIFKEKVAAHYISELNPQAIPNVPWRSFQFSQHFSVVNASRIQS
ncbi:uncharacterized protein G2W53_007793 [Senna tora]|uniref:Uncharacterized protein n=1 Tax=Senna tora TaxID=362788 RepID=A0A835CF91_9FABA|nr:uncharacterized protein G2W53_007793 [Senna tora]